MLYCISDEALGMIWPLHRMALLSPRASAVPELKFSTRRCFTFFSTDTQINTHELLHQRETHFCIHSNTLHQYSLVVFTDIQRFALLRVGLQFIILDHDFTLQITNTSIHTNKLFSYKTITSLDHVISTQTVFIIVVHLRQDIIHFDDISVTILFQYHVDIQIMSLLSCLTSVQSVIWNYSYYISYI